MKGSRIILGRNKGGPEPSFNMLEILWRLTSRGNFKQETRAHQVHGDTDTYRNRAGPTHFSQLSDLQLLCL